MQRFTPSQRNFAYAVAALAGYVDVTGYFQLKGYFVSFMTGNTTLLAHDLASGNPRMLVPALLLAGFVIGVTIGTLAGDRAAEQRKRRVMELVLGGLVLAAAARALGAAELALGLLVMAMGATNTVMSGNRRESPVGLTYMTGALVRTGQLIADRLRGDVSARPWLFAGLWASLLVGALGGALVAIHIPALSLWLAAAGAALLWLRARRLPATAR